MARLTARQQKVINETQAEIRLTRRRLKRILTLNVASADLDDAVGYLDDAIECCQAAIDNDKEDHEET